jgi:glycosyltransferase involved in cell wall biosynthesis
MVTATANHPRLSEKPAPTKEELRPRAAHGSLHVIVSATTLGLGGIRTHLSLLCQLLRRENISVTVFATGSHWDGDSISILERRGVRFKLPPAALRKSRKLASMYSTLSWPILIPQRANSLYCIGAGRSHFLMHRLRPRGAVSINHEIVEPPGPKSLAGACAARLEATVANSRKVAERMQSLWPKKPIKTIPFLTSDQAIPPPARRRFVGLRPLRVTYVGRLVEQKRPDKLVRSWRHLTTSPLLTGAELDVYGYDPEGRMITELRAFVNDSGMADQIRVHGEYKLEGLPAILHKADLIVLPSLWEGLPLVLVEAMQHGVPFVATAAGGTEELGHCNPDVIITRTDWSDFEAGLLRMAARIHSGEIDHRRLHGWVEERYGFGIVSKRWLDCLQRPRTFFNLDD